MRSPSAWLFAKELRELAASRAWWLLLFIIGPLVGHAFITAMDVYADASGIGGGPAALAQGLSPLDGILVPAFGAYDLAVTLLFPFVAIRVISAEKESGAWKLVLQSPPGLAAVLTAKFAALLTAWLVAWLPGLLAVLLWTTHGGHIAAPELLNLLFGHLLRVILSAGVAVTAASITRGAASAAIITLGFTLGTWALDFMAAGRGGLLQALASYTPTAALRVFEQGELRLRTVVILLLLGLTGFLLGGIWLAAGIRVRARLGRSAATLAGLALVVWGAAHIRSSWDLSENRRNSFPPAVEASLQRIRSPLDVTVYLAAEDPRLMDLDRNILARLKRVLPAMNVTYAVQSRSGLFEGAADHYGEVWYTLDGRRVMSRSTTEPIVLETLFQLARVPEPAQPSEAAYPGYPLAAHAPAAPWVFYLAWPLTVAALGWLHLRK